jgi:hypothetical protein
MGMKLSDETMNVIRCAKPIVSAINALHEAYHHATDILLEECDEEFDDHELDPVRDLAHEQMEKLFHELNELIAPHSIEIRFNRLDATYYLLDKA